jgi:acyl dehydratase
VTAPSVVRPAYADVTAGDELPPNRFTLTRAMLVRYAGASGDFNVIHWNERTARAVGLPDVIAHGMLTMAKAVQVVSDWAGDPAAVVEYSTRFTRPVPVPDDDQGAVLEVSATVAEKLGSGRVRVDITARHADQKVLGVARAVVQLA